MRTTTAIAKTNETTIKYNNNNNNNNEQTSSDEVNLSSLSDDQLATWGIEHSSDLNYRIELARRIAVTFNNSKQLIIFDDIAVQILDSNFNNIDMCRGFDRSLLPALWLSPGFRYGGRILVYLPPNPVELRAYLKLKYLMEQRIQRKVSIEILYEDENNHLIELIQLFENNSEQYMILCEKVAEGTSKKFYPRYHIDMLKRHMEIITKDVSHSFVFPYCMTELHRVELKMYSDRLSLPDIPMNDKAQHHFFLKSNGFQALPKLIGVALDGTLIDCYEEYKNTVKNIDGTRLNNTPHNIKTFSQGVINAIDQLHHKFNLSAFVKLDSWGAGGWSSMSPTVHSIIYDYEKDPRERVSYLEQHIQSVLYDESLPVMAVVEELIEPEKRSGDIDADYTVCGFVLNGIFFPTSINLCGTENGAYIEQWTASTPIDLNDSLEYWKQMYNIYSIMVRLEASEFGYQNGIYAGDLFVTKDGQLKQRDWNIRRGGRSSPESLTIFNMPNYETKVIVNMVDLELEGKMSSLELFQAYTKIADCLVKDYDIYIFSSGFGYDGKSNDHGDFLKFNILIHPKNLMESEESMGKYNLNRHQHRKRLIELIKNTAIKILCKNSTTS